MLSRGPFRANEANGDGSEWERIQARLDALEHDQTNDQTRPIHLPGSEMLREDRAQALSTTISDGAADTEVAFRAYFLTVEGGILAEIPCAEEAGTITIGRGRAAEIRVNDPYVHRLQAEIRWDADAKAHFIRHGGGENGTYVKGNRIEQPLQLRGGEHLRFGKTELTYRIRP